MEIYLLLISYFGNGKVITSRLGGQYLIGYVADQSLFPAWQPLLLQHAMQPKLVARKHFIGCCLIAANKKRSRHQFWLHSVFKQQRLPPVNWI